MALLYSVWCHWRFRISWKSQKNYRRKNGSPPDSYRRSMIMGFNNVSQPYGNFGSDWFQEGKIQASEWEKEFYKNSHSKFKWKRAATRWTTIPAGGGYILFSFNGSNIHFLVDYDAPPCRALVVSHCAWAMCSKVKMMLNIVDSADDSAHATTGSVFRSIMKWKRIAMMSQKNSTLKSSSNQRGNLPLSQFPAGYTA